METNYFAIVAVRTQTHSLAIAFDHAESEDILIELKRAIEISDLQADAAETSGIRQPVSTRANSSPPSRW